MHTCIYHTLPLCTTMFSSIWRYRVCIYIYIYTLSMHYIYIIYIYTRYIYVIYTLYIRYIYVIYTLYIRYIYVIFTLYLRYIYVIYTLYIRYIYVIYTLYIYTLYIRDIYVIFTLYIRYIYVIYTLYIRCIYVIYIYIYIHHIFIHYIYIVYIYIYIYIIYGGFFKWCIRKTNTDTSQAEATPEVKPPAGAWCWVEKPMVFTSKKTMDFTRKNGETWEKPWLDGDFTCKKLDLCYFMVGFIGFGPGSNDDKDESKHKMCLQAVGIETSKPLGFLHTINLHRDWCVDMMYLWYSMQPSMDSIKIKIQGNLRCESPWSLSDMKGFNDGWVIISRSPIKGSPTKWGPTHNCSVSAFWSYSPQNGYIILYWYIHIYIYIHSVYIYILIT